MCRQFSPRWKKWAQIVFDVLNVVPLINRTIKLFVVGKIELLKFILNLTSISVCGFPIKGLELWSIHIPKQLWWPRYFGRESSSGFLTRKWSKASRNPLQVRTKAVQEAPSVTMANRRATGEVVFCSNGLTAQMLGQFCLTRNFLLYIGVNYKYHDTLIVPIIENTPEENELTVSSTKNPVMFLGGAVSTIEPPEGVVGWSSSLLPPVNHIPSPYHCIASAYQMTKEVTTWVKECGLSAAKRTCFCW